MTRKDTILVAVVINAGLLAILFATAIIYDEEINDDTITSELTLNPSEQKTQESSKIAAKTTSSEASVDEVDNILRDYRQENKTVKILAEMTPMQEEGELSIPKSEPLKKEVSTPNTNRQEAPVKIAAKDPVLKSTKKDEPAKVQTKNEPVYHTVKSGDNPWKIAKQYGVKYDELLRLNNLNEEKARNLKIGDKVRVK